jgi:hypothetical protein
MLRRFREAYTKGSDNEDILTLMAKAEWMMNTGHTSAEWDELPLGDVQLLTAHYQFVRDREREDTRIGIGLAFQKSKG